jgi:hypothetical protein
VVAVDDPVEVDSPADLPEATTSESTPPVTLGASDLSQSNDNTTVFLIAGGIGLVALAIIIIWFARRPSNM